MKESKYNIIQNIEGDTYICFNSRNNALVELNRKYVDALKNINEVNNQKIIDDLKSVGLILDDSVNEIELLKYFHNKEKFSKNRLTVTIAPTLDCNFACPYCFENKHHGKMSDVIQDKFIELLNSNTKNCEQLEIIWYGGEPLLALDVIKKLHRNILNIVKQNKIKYTSFMITNGYLINEKNIQQLKELSINTIQITLDGSPKINDKRRILKSSEEGTFWKILDGIKLSKKHDIDVVVRVNVDKINLYDIEDFLKILVDENLKDLKVAFGHVLPYTDTCGHISGNCLTKKEYAGAVLKLQSLLHKYGFKHDKFIYPQIKCVYCDSSAINTFLLDPSGYLYKCWCDVGNVSESIGNIMDIDSDVMLSDITTAPNFIRWIEHNPFDIEECLNCNVLPICMGGCPKIGLSNKSGNECDFWKYNIEDIMKYMHDIS